MRPADRGRARWEDRAFRTVVIAATALVLVSTIASTLMRDIRVNSDHTYYMLTGYALLHPGSVRDDHDAITEVMRDRARLGGRDVAAGETEYEAGVYHHELRGELFRSYIGAASLYRLPAAFDPQQEREDYVRDPGYAFARELIVSLGFATLVIAAVFLASLALLRSAVVLTSAFASLFLLSALLLSPTWGLDLPMANEVTTQGLAGVLERSMKNFLNMDIEMGPFHYTPRSSVFMLGLLAFVLRADGRRVLPFAALAIAATLNSQMALMVAFGYLAIDIVLGDALEQEHRYWVAAAAAVGLATVLSPVSEWPRGAILAAAIGALLLARRRGRLGRLPTARWAEARPSAARLAAASLLVAIVAGSAVVSWALSDDTAASRLGIAVLPQRTTAAFQPVVLFLVLSALASLVAHRLARIRRSVVLVGVALAAVVGSVWISGRNDRFFLEYGGWAKKPLITAVRQGVAEQAREWIGQSQRPSTLAHIPWDPNTYGYLYIPMILDQHLHAGVLDRDLRALKGAPVPVAGSSPD